MPFIIEVLQPKTLQDIDGTPRTVEVWERPNLGDTLAYFNYRETAEIVLKLMYLVSDDKKRIVEVES